MNRRVLPVLLGLVLLAIVLSTLLAGDPIWAVPALILVGLIAAMATVEFGLKKRLERRHDGEPERAMQDSTDPIPGTHLATDDQTPLGDTPEAHDELSPHDLPKDHPGRAAAEEQAARGEQDEPVTRGQR